MIFLETNEPYPITKDIIWERIEIHNQRGYHYPIHGKSLVEREEDCWDYIKTAKVDPSLGHPYFYCSKNSRRRFGDNFVNMNTLARCHKIFGGMGTNLFSNKNRESLDAMDLNPDIFFQDNVKRGKYIDCGLNGYNVMPLTTLKWKPDIKKKIVATQFNTGGRYYKRISEKNQILLTQGLKSMGYTPIEIGAGYSVKDCLAIASNALFFVGGESGMSHLCKSIGMPIHILSVSKWRVEKYQKDKTYRNFELVCHVGDWDNDLKEVVEYNFLRWLK